MSSKYLPSRDTKLKGRDETVMCLFFHICAESNQTLAVSPELHIWFARWCNNTTYERKNESIRLWLDDSSRLLHTAKSQVQYETHLTFYQQAYERDPAAKVFTASLALLSYATKADIDEAMSEQIVRAYDVNYFYFTKLQVFQIKIIQYFQHLQNINKMIRIYFYSRIIVGAFSTCSHNPKSLLSDCLSLSTGSLCTSHRLK